MDAYHTSSSAGGGVVSLLRVLYRFLFDVPGGYGRNLTSGMNGACLVSSATMDDSGTNAVMYPIMGVVEGVSTPDYETMLVLEIEMTILYEKSPQLLQLQTQ